MNKLLPILCCFIASAVFCIKSAAYDFPKHAPIIEGIDYDTALTYCQNAPINHIEGIWLFTNDNLTCLIRKSPKSADKVLSDYEIIALKSDDLKICCGTVIGYIHPTPDIYQYKMFLYSEALIHGLTKPRACAAYLSKDFDSISIKCTEWKVKFNPLGLLPGLWKILRLTQNNPASQLPEGLIKIEPSYDGNGSSRREPRYL